MTYILRVQAAGGLPDWSKDGVSNTVKKSFKQKTKTAA
jgi:hypothetical protein